MTGDTWLLVIFFEAETTVVNVLLFVAGVEVTGGVVAGVEAGVVAVVAPMRFRLSAVATTPSLLMTGVA